MHPDAIAQAKIRVGKAKSAVAKMEAAKDFDVFEAAWTDFLVAANTVYTKLEEGSKISGSSNGWFGRMKHERRNDELLNYIHHARNSDEHSIAKVTERSGSYVAINPKPGRPLNVSLTMPAADTISISVPSPEDMPDIVIGLPHVRLLPVQSRQKDWFRPPTSHRGEALTSEQDGRVLDIARKALAYLEWLVSEAEQRVA